MTEGWLPAFIAHYGPAGVAALTFAETVFPPIPSELVMPLSGMAAAKGQMSLGAAIFAGLLGSMAGNLLFYLVPRRLGGARLAAFVARHGRWLTLHPADLAHIEQWFARYGGPATFAGRMVPGIRSVISIPAGLMNMPLGVFLAWSTAGTLMWTATLTTIGYLLGRASIGRIEGIAGPLSNAVVVLLLATYIWRVIRFERAG